MNNKYKNNKNKDFSKKNFSRKNDRTPERNRKQYNDGDGYEAGLENGSVPGRNAVRELLKSGRTVEKIYGFEKRRGDPSGCAE